MVEGWILRREPLAPLDGARMARRPMFFTAARAVSELKLPQSPVRDALRDAAEWYYAAGARAAPRPSGRGGGGLMAVHAPPDLLPAARGALERGRDRLLADQDPGGWWWAELESNATIVAEHVFLITMLGIARDDDLRRLANDLRARQGADGGWPLWYDGPSDLSTTVEAYYALRLAGAPADDPALRPRPRARAGARRRRTGRASSPSCGSPCRGATRGRRSR